MAALDVFSSSLFIDEAYEFSAPRFYDFKVGESDEDAREAELWFENARSYPPSPFMPRIKGSSRKVEQILCDFSEDNQIHKEASESEPESLNQAIDQAEIRKADENKQIQTLVTEISQAAENKENIPDSENTLDGGKTISVSGEDAHQGCCTPAAQPKEENNKMVQTTKKKASTLRNHSAMNSKKMQPNSHVKSTTKPVSIRRDPNAKNIVGTPIFAQENHAIKRQKLDGGKSKQILTVNKPSNLPHKTRTGIVKSNSSFSSSDAKTTSKEDRKMYVREPAEKFVSMAEMMRKFQSGTREVSLPSSSSCSQSGVGAMQRKTKLTLTRPKTPEFETTQRVRSTKVKSSAEIEEEMMAKAPKFKARPLNKKIFETPSLPPLPRSTPHLPEFKEFHLETMSRAHHNVDVSSVVSTDSIEVKSHKWKNQLTTPKSPHLQTSLRARPSKIKTFDELEKEELENIPQFKARPLNRKIFDSKGDMGIFSNMKKEVTIPQEFNFAVDKRIPPPTAVVNLFDKLSISSDSKPPLPPKLTTPNPFHLITEERGAEKERRLAEELTRKQMEEEKARVPQAFPYPYTTDYPVIPPKPEPKPCTKPSPFQLESLARHEEERQREMEERKRMEKEEEEMRKFKAQPILKEDPIPVPEKERKPLTQVQEFNLHVIHRAVDRAEFDKKMKEKEMYYKRYREETEAAKMMEEEKALKQMRRTLVVHARPVPSFDHPFLPQKSGKEITKPKSPKLRVNRRKQKLSAATGAAAFHMR